MLQEDAIVLDRHQISRISWTEDGQARTRLSWGADAGNAFAAPVPRSLFPPAAVTARRPRLPSLPPLRQILTAVTANGDIICHITALATLSAASDSRVCYVTGKARATAPRALASPFALAAGPL